MTVDISNLTHCTIKNVIKFSIVLAGYYYAIYYATVALKVGWRMAVTMAVTKLQTSALLNFAVWIEVSRTIWTFVVTKLEEEYDVKRVLILAWMYHVLIH